ncbi:DoxX family protein [Nocardia sp. NPDC051832]|uniref:DoxX family protein n=1 Tax=Nocardia sp. NPDC051832 TaxID=3155673 RepID=UPI003429BAF5
MTTIEATPTTTSRLQFASSLDNAATDIGLLVVRVVFGGLMAAFGAQKLFGWFNGYGLAATQQMFEGMGYNPGTLFGTLAGVSELVGGLLLIFGLGTPLAAAIVTGTMLNAVNATWANGLFGTAEGPGYQSALTFAAVAVAIGFTGAGKFALDAGRPWERKGFVIGAGALGLAIVTAVLTLILKWVL